MIIGGTGHQAKTTKEPDGCVNIHVQKLTLKVLVAACPPHFLESNAETTNNILRYHRNRV
jgi:hypothetical protein